MTLYSDLSAAIAREDAGAITGWARGLLSEVAAGTAPVTVVRHPLGFLCLPAHRSGDEGVCLHLWGTHWARAAPTTSTIHCHSWDLVSWILAGTLHNQTLRLVEGAGEPTHRVFEVRSSAEGDAVEPTGRLVRVEVDGITTHRAGEGYAQRAGVFHQTLVPDDLVATVALGVTRPGAVDLSLGDVGTTGHRVRRQACAPAEAAAAVRAALAAVRVTEPTE